MQKKIRFFYELIISLALLLSVASCSMDGGSVKPSPAEGTKAGGKTLVIRANVSTEKQRNASARSAVPSDFMGADGNALVFAGALYDKTSGTDKNFKKAEYNEGKITLSLEIERLSDGEEVERTLEIRAYKCGTEDFSDAPLLFGMATITIGANAIEVSAPQITLKPYADSEENGAVNLAILIPDEYILSAVCSGGTMEFTVTEVEIGGYKKFNLSADGVPQGIYEVNFQLKTSDDADDGNIAYLWSEPINVFPGMTTDAWNDDAGEVENGARKVSRVRIFSTFYVVGEEPKSDWFKANPPQSDGTPNGSLSQPYKKIQDAIDRVIAINDGGTLFSIAVDGTVKQDEAPVGTGMADFSNLEKTLELTIYAVSESADGGATLDANGMSCVVYASPDSASDATLNLTLKNLIITGGKTETNGGGIFIAQSADLTMANCEIKGCHSSTRGGAVYNAGNLTMNDCTINGNEATLSGGGVYVDSKGIFTATNCTINGNEATVSGGGVYVDSKGIFTATNCDISGNEARNSGGGVCVNVNGIFTATNCDISGNEATGSGGGVCVSSSGTFTMSGGTINGNTANGTINGGGGIYVMAGGTLSMSDGATISGNISKYNGGGIYFSSNSDERTLTLTEGITISGNTASNNGGGVYAYRAASTSTVLIMEGGTISGNTAKYGGGVYADCSFEMTGGEILNNGEIEGNDIKTSDGGGVFAYRAFTMSGDAKINNNKATTSGGGVYNDSNGTFTMLNGTISGNATEQGAGVYTKGMFEMNDGTISKNTATTNGGGVFDAGEGLKFKMIGGVIGGIVETDKNTAYQGGGVYIAENSEFEMSGGKISCNKADNSNSEGYGGGLYVSVNGAFKMSDNAAISGNKTLNGAGGGIFSSNGTITMEGGTIDGNHSSRGGGIWLSNSSTFTMKTGKISENDAQNQGGGICLYSSSFEMKGGEISENSAKSGGGILINESTFEMSGNAMITGNTATKGNGVYAWTNAIFSMADSAKISENNEVCFKNTNGSITITAPLTATPPVATITPSEYTEDLQILTAGENREIDDEICSKFKITSNPNDSEWKEWKITPSTDNATGVLKKDGVSGGIEIVTPDFETYIFTVDVGGEPLIDVNDGGEYLKTGQIVTLSKVVDSKGRTPSGSLKVAFRDMAAIEFSPVLFPNATATGNVSELSESESPLSVTVPLMPPAGPHPLQVYLELTLDSVSVINKIVYVATYN